MKKSLLLALLLVSLFAVRASAVDLSYNLKVGSSYVQSMKTTFNMGMNLGGQAMNISSTATSHMTYTVTSVKDTCYEIDVRYDSVDVTMSGPTGNQNLSSRLSSASSQLSDVFKQFVNKTFQLTLSKKGKVVDVRNYEALTNAIQGAGQSAQSGNTQLSSQLEQSFGKQAFLSNMESYVSFFPAKPVNIGESWTCSNKMVTSGFPIEALTTYTLKGVTDNQYNITGVSSMKVDKVGNLPTTLQGMDVNMGVKGVTTFEIVLNRSTGWMNQLTGKIDLDVDINVGGAQNQSITMKITGDIASNDH